MKISDISIIGPGALGSPLLSALLLAGYPIHSVWSRSPEKCRLAREAEKVELNSGFPEEPSYVGQVLFLTVPDDEIGSLATRLAGSGDRWAGRMVVHCSGNESSELLAPLQERGAVTLSMHPLQTFVRKEVVSGNASSDAELFREITITIEGENAVARRELTKLVERLGARALPLDRDQKRKLHLAAVFLSNYVVSLGEIADRIIRDAMDGESARILQPLLQQTVHNMDREDLSGALSGPIARGDTRSVNRHLSLVRENPLLDKLYRHLGSVALELARRKGSIDMSAAEKLKEYFEGSDE
ncbi:MAG: Rossmann-like and DUF2520 domain-containing protein [Balneolaceae bacterium]